MKTNKLIAEFMGLKKVPCSIGTENGIVTEGYLHNSVSVPVIPSGMEYKYKWDWLMPVVDKIESIVFDDDNSFNVTIGSTIYCVIQDSKGECYEVSYDGGETKLAVVYKAVVEFIKWYNDNKETFK